jgi:uncharacterized protein with HEPN domain
MIRFCEKVVDYTGGYTKEHFVADTRTYDATLRNIELIGEAAMQVPDEVRAAHSEIAWRMIVATRNRLIHGYLGIDDDTIWSIINDDIPRLIPQLNALKREQA